MAKQFTFRGNAHRAQDPGIGAGFEKPLDRVLGKDGKFQVQRSSSIYLKDGFTALTTMGPFRLLATVFLGYFILNLIFAGLYILVGVEQIGNADLTSLSGKWMTAMGMSLETLTTVGYGSLYPTSPSTWLVAGVEGVFGILGFSLIGAVIFARFARPTARLAHSGMALVAPFKEGWSVQMRLANRRSTLLSQVEASLMLVLADRDGEAEKLEYFNLPLQMDRVSYLPLSWTIVHPLNTDSPLAGMSLQEMTDRRAEMILTIKGVDEVYMQQVIARMSYRFDEVVWGGRFIRPFSAKEGIMHLDLDMIGAHEKVEGPERLPG
ncbi:MAG: ion channel [Flavobacteriales bacterium]